VSAVLASLLLAAAQGISPAASVEAPGWHLPDTDVPTGVTAAAAIPAREARDNAEAYAALGARSRGDYGPVPDLPREQVPAPSPAPNQRGSGIDRQWFPELNESPSVADEVTPRKGPR
jgi:hypothetical protein